MYGTSEEAKALDMFNKGEGGFEEIERRLGKLGCTKEQVRRHLDQVAVSRTEAAREKSKPRSKGR